MAPIEQVKEIDVINGTINEAISLEEHEPDRAIGLLRQALAGLKRAKMADTDAERTFARLEKRIKQRDTARENISALCNKADEMQMAGDYIKSVDTLSEAKAELEVAKQFQLAANSMDAKAMELYRLNVLERIGRGEGSQIVVYGLGEGDQAMGQQVAASAAGARVARPRQRATPPAEKPASN